MIFWYFLCKLPTWFTIFWADEIDTDLLSFRSLCHLNFLGPATTLQQHRVPGKQTRWWRWIYSQTRFFFILYRVVSVLIRQHKTGGSLEFLFLTWASVGRPQCCQSFRWSGRRSGGRELFSWTAALLGFLGLPSPQSPLWQSYISEATKYRRKLDVI